MRRQAKARRDDLPLRASMCIVRRHVNKQPVTFTGGQIMTTDTAPLPCRRSRREEPPMLLTEMNALATCEATDLPSGDIYQTLSLKNRQFYPHQSQ